MVSCEPKSYLPSDVRRLLRKQPGRAGRKLSRRFIFRGRVPKNKTMPTATRTILAKGANDFIEQQLDSRILEIERLFDADAITFSGPLVFGVEKFMRVTVEEKYQRKPKRKKLVVLLTTNGGYLEGGATGGRRTTRPLQIS